MKEKFLNTIAEAFEVDSSDEIKMNQEFRQHDNWDSLTKLSLIAALDEEFDVIIEDKEFENLHTFEDLFEHIKK